MVNEKIVIYTDGACSGNPGKGGWGAILKYGDHTKEISGYAELTTNNKMELQAVIEALKLIKKDYDIEIFTDSNYVKNGITKWINTWKLNNWKTSKRESVKNKELWQEMLKLLNNHKYKFVKVENVDIEYKLEEIIDDITSSIINESQYKSTDELEKRPIPPRPFLLGGSSVQI